MGKTIEIRLSDAQHAQLTAEAASEGLPFFGYCREKLTAQMTTRLPPTPANPGPRLSPPPKLPEDNRIDRLEAMMMEMGRAIQNLANPAYVVEGPQEPEDPIDVDSIVNAQFQEAEAQGLTERVPDENEEVMRYAGVRPLARSAPKFSSTPRHLQGL